MFNQIMVDYMNSNCEFGAEQDFCRWTADDICPIEGQRTYCRSLNWDNEVLCQTCTNNLLTIKLMHPRTIENLIAEVAELRSDMSAFKNLVI